MYPWVRCAYCVMAVVPTVGYVTFHIAHSLLWFLVRIKCELICIVTCCLFHLSLF